MAAATKHDEDDVERRPSQVKGESSFNLAGISCKCRAFSRLLLISLPGWAVRPTSLAAL